MLEQLRRRAPRGRARVDVGDSSPAARRRCRPPRRRGLSDAYGSWKTICMRLRCGRIAPRPRVRDVLAVEPDRARGRLDQAQHQLADGRLAAAGFADQAQRLAAVDREADAVDRLAPRGRARRAARAAAGSASSGRATSSDRRSCGRPLVGAARARPRGRRRCGRRRSRAAPAPRRGSARSRRRSAARRRSRRSARAARARCRGSRRGGACGRRPVERAGSRPSGRACRDGAAGRTARRSAPPRPCGPHTSRRRGRQVSATTPRSWVIRITAAPVRSFSSQHQVEDLRLDGDVERGGRLVGDQQRRDRRPAPSRSSRAGACRRRTGADTRRARRSASGMCTSRSISTARVARAAARSRRCGCAPPRRSGGRR